MLDRVVIILDSHNYSEVEIKRSLMTYIESKPIFKEIFRDFQMNLIRNDIDQNQCILMKIEKYFNLKNYICELYFIQLE
jgi:hypothetical protein